MQIIREVPSVQRQVLESDQRRSAHQHRSHQHRHHHHHHHHHHRRRDADDVAMADRVGASAGRSFADNTAMNMY